jgi:hypothetical protein
VKKIYLTFILSFFTIFQNGFCEETFPIDDEALATISHSPYISFDTSRQEAGIGYRFRHNFFMYDVHGSYRFLKYSYSHGHLASFSFHFMTIAKDSVSFLFYSGVGIRGEFYSLTKTPFPVKDRLSWCPSFCWGYTFKKRQGPSPFAEVYFIPTRFFRNTYDHIRQIGLKVGVLY